jgi:hypothetical protein
VAAEGRLAADNGQIQKDLLWSYYIELRNHARHADTMRASATHYVMLLATASIGAVVVDEQFTRTDLPFSLILMCVGLFGGFFSASYLNRTAKNRKRAEMVRKKLDDLFLPEGMQMSVLKDAADSALRTQKGYRRLDSSVFDIHLYWLGLPLVVFGLGALMTLSLLAGVRLG